MPAPLRVYGVTAFTRFSPRQLDVLVAAPNRRAAAALIGCSDYTLAKYGHRVGSASDRALALLTPGVVFLRPGGAFGAPWRPAPGGA